MEGFKNETHTSLTFTRPLDTCDDKQDLKIESGTVKLIWSYSERLPSSPNHVSYHGHKVSWQSSWCRVVEL